MPWRRLATCVNPWSIRILEATVLRLPVAQSGQDLPVAVGRQLADSTLQFLHRDEHGTG